MEETRVLTGPVDRGIVEEVLGTRHTQSGTPRSITRVLDPRQPPSCPLTHSETPRPPSTFDPRPGASSFCPVTFGFTSRSPWVTKKRRVSRVPVVLV